MRCQSKVRNAPVDVVLRREVLRLAPDVVLAVALVHAHVVDIHLRRELDLIEIRLLP